MLALKIGVNIVGEHHFEGITNKFNLTIAKSG